MHDLRRTIKERPEIRFDRIQLMWLTFGILLAMGLAFSLGFMSGRRAERLQIAALSDADPSPVVSTDPKSVKRELKFYDLLKEPSRLKSIDAVKTPTVSAPVASAAEGPVNTNVLPPVKTTTSVVAAAQTPGLHNGPAAKGEYTVQVSAFQSEEEAKAFSATLERKGYKPFIVASTIPGKGTWYRVRLGRFDNESRATEAKIELAHADIAAWVLKND